MLEDAEGADAAFHQNKIDRLDEELQMLQQIHRIKTMEHGLEDLKKAVQDEEALRWKMKAAEVRIDLYRTQESSRRGGF